MGRKQFSGLVAVIAIALGFAVCASAGSSGSDKDGLECVSCHEDIWDAAKNKRYIHLPFEEKQCEKCHAANSRSDNTSDTRTEDSDVTWLGRNSTPAKIHWFDFEVNKPGSLLLVEARASRTGFATKEISLPQLDKLDRVDGDDQKPPRISNVKVLEVNKGIFLSATVGWETDKPANSKVVYGLNELSQQTPLDGQFSMNHMVSLTGIKANKEYVFSVVSEDMSGNRTESKAFTLSTTKTFSDSETVVGEGDRSGGPVEFSSELFNNGKGYSVKITANRAVTVSVGLKDMKYVASSSNQGDGPEVVKHVVTNSEAVTTISVCYSCHTEYKKILSHPINVYPKRGMKIPPEYPTLSNGRITCMSCHATHASNLQYRMLKSHKRDLCVGCHVDMV